jgi:pimeloyl-ACP methyl ester carboxylesterase
MPIFERGDVRLHYREEGSGFPVLLIAPGGMRSAISFWEDHTPWNPIAQLSDRYRVIAMDQRNAGQSTAPISGCDGWHTYTADQLALLDHLGVSRFAVAGMCIGGSYIMALIATAPERVAAGVVFQTIGLDGNRQAFLDMFDSWAESLRDRHPEASDNDLETFRSNMYGGDRFLFTADERDVSACRTPLLVLLGNDLYHPESASRKLAELAPRATLVERWKDPADQPAAMAAMERFLAEHTVGG